MKTRGKLRVEIKDERGTQNTEHTNSKGCFSHVSELCLMQARGVLWTIRVLVPRDERVIGHAAGGRPGGLHLFPTQGACLKNVFSITGFWRFCLIASLFICKNTLPLALLFSFGYKKGLDFCYQPRCIPVSLP